MSRSALMACVLVVMAMSGLFASAQTAAAETRSLKIYFVHTGEKQDIIFKRNGRYDPKGLQALNTILRDWRRNEATKMDPRLFDLVWSVYKQSRSSGYIYVVSGYRSPATNAMLRSRSRGVAKESQHMHGTAMDFFIPGTPLKTLRDIGLKMQAGGVGYYPNSGSPFVHMDVAGVRSWPRLPRDELVRLFPDGKTLHIPADGRPLPGYQVAMEEYKRRLGSQQILMADSSSSSHRKSKNLFAMLFGGGDEDEGDEDVAPAKATAPPPVARQQQQELTNPSPVVVASAAPAPSMPDISAPVPLSRPTSTQGNDSLAVALYSPGGRNAAEDALQKVASNQPTSIPFGKAQPDAGDGYQDLSEYKIPVPTMLDTRGMKGDAENVMTASLAPGSLPPVEDGVMRIPVPAGRPALADAIAATMPQQDVASANAQSTNAQREPATVEEAMLSPAAAKALEMSEAASNKVATVTPLDRPAENTASQIAAVPEPRPYIVAPAASTPKQELASLEPVSPSAKRRSGEFGDVFDQPKAAAQAIEASVPVKGARPGPSEAEVATRGMSGGKVLTRAMLSQWAMAKNHIEAPSAVSRGGRVVIDPPASAPAQALPVGFSDKAPRIDPARFGAIR